MAESITIKALQDASLDAKSLEEVVNGNESKQVTTRKGETYPSVKKAIKTLFENGGLPATPFATKALMTASALADGDYAMVTDETVNNGLYVKTAGAWVKSDYDPLTQAKVDATTKVDAAKIEVMAQVDAKIYIDEANTDDIIQETDVNGRVVRKVTKEGKHLFIGLDTDLVSKFDEVDASDLIASGAGDDIINVKDSNGNDTIKQDRFGDIHAPRVGNITQAIIDLQSKSGGSEGINLQAANLAGKYADYGLMQNIESYSNTETILSGASVNALAIFPHNVTAVRIPAITRIGKTKYLLHFEAREAQNDFSNISMGVATIDIDLLTKAVAISDIKSMHNSFIDIEGKLRTFMNPCSVKLDSGKIICLYVRRYGLTEHELYMRTSTDDGVTWSDFTDISSVKDSQNLNALLPCSQGLVKRYGKHKGRIVFPVWTTGTAYSSVSYRSGYMYSDDDGDSWVLGDFVAYPTSTEVQIAESVNGDMLFCVRLDNEDPPQVLTMLSDETKEYSEVVTNKPLTDDAIMSGLIQGENIYDYTANKFQLTTCKNSNRSELLIHTSYDNGTTWRTYLMPSTIGKPVAYSCIENISAKYKFLLWESAGTTAFSCAVISLDKLIEVV